jgi:hypothetical protein
MIKAPGRPLTQTISVQANIGRRKDAARAKAQLLGRLASVEFRAFHILT